MLTGATGRLGVATDAAGVGWAAASGCGVAGVAGAFLGVVPRRRVWATDAVESVNKIINDRAPRAVFIQNSLFFLADNRRTFS